MSQLVAKLIFWAGIAMIIAGLWIMMARRNKL
jgi:hypothetical protein